MNLRGRQATIMQFAGCELIVIDIRAREGCGKNWYTQFLRQAQYLGAEHFAPFNYDFSEGRIFLGCTALIPLLDYLKWTKAAVAVGAMACEAKISVRAGSFGRVKLMSDGFDFYWLKPMDSASL